MKNLKRILSAALAFVLALSLTVPGFAAGSGYADVSPDAWYKGAVDYVTEHGLMDGVGNGRFAPGGVTSQAMLVTILWRMADEPVVNYLMQFSDVAGNDWYTEAVRWAASEQIMGGYGNGLFGTNDPVSREQIAATLWRYEGSPEAVSTPI